MMMPANETSELIVRPMAVSDIDAVIRIAAQSETAPHWPREVYESAISPESMPLRLALAADSLGEIMGFLIATVIAGESELESIVVASRVQRRGVAKALFTRLTADLRAAEVERIMLEVRESNTSAQAFYLGVGFEVTGRRREYYHSPPEDALLLELRISGCDECG